MDRPESIRTRVLDGIEQAAKVVAAVVTLTAAAAFVIPPLGTAVAMLTTWRFGVVGYVYYEIGKDRELTKQGNLHLLKAGDGSFKSIEVGDMLRVGKGGVVNVRERYEAREESKPIIFRVLENDCVIVFETTPEISVKEAQSGGWLKVGTTACGLFR